MEINWEKETTLTQEEKFFMREAIAEAKKAEGLAEVPIGAVIVRQGEIIGRGHNLREARQNNSACRNVCNQKRVAG